MDTPYETPELNPNKGANILSTQALNYLLKGAGWAKFLSIIGFIVAGIIAIMALCIGTVFSSLSRLNPAGSMIPSAVGSVVTIIYLAIAAVIFVLHLFLFQFASRTQKAIAYNDAELMDGGIHRLHSYFKALGIIMIVYLAFMVVGILGMVSFMAMLPPHAPSATSF